jgi:hypothetical protein
MNADDWRREDSAATVIARTIRSVRFVEALERMQVEGIDLGPGVLTLMEQYAEGALRMPELVYRAHARMAFEATQRTQGPS